MKSIVFLFTVLQLVSMMVQAKDSDKDLRLCYQKFPALAQALIVPEALGKEEVQIGVASPKGSARGLRECKRIMVDYARTHYGPAEEGFVRDRVDRL